MSNGTCFFGYVLLAVLLLACGDSTAPEGGARIVVTTSGNDLDLDGYRASVDGAPSVEIPGDGVLVLTDLSPGTHTLALEGVAPNCTVAPQGTHSFTVTAGSTVLVPFEVECLATGISVFSNTTGPDIDTEYGVVVDGQPSLPLVLGEGLDLTRLSPGDHSIELVGVASHCTVAGGPLRTVTLAVGDMVALGFDISCVAVTGALKVTLNMTGTGTDPNGFLLRVDGQHRWTFMQSGTAVISKVPGGAREVLLDNLDFTCRAGEGGARRSVNIRVGTMTRDTVAVSFIVDCGLSPQFAFAQDGLIKADLGDGSGVRVLSEGESPAWSPDGERIAFTKGGRIALMESDGSGLVTIGQDMPTSGRVAWSPDGARLAYATLTCDEYDNCGLGGIFLIRTDGSGRQQVPAPDTLYQAWDFDWSPDGSTLAFTCIVRGGGYDVCVIRTDGSGFGVITTPSGDNTYSHPSWSPDGSELVFGLDGEYTQLLIARPDGTGLRWVTNWAVAAISPEWSPDGEWILFASTWGLVGLHIIRPDGTGMRTVFPGLASSPSWRP